MLILTPTKTAVAFVDVTTFMMYLRGILTIFYGNVSLIFSSLMIRAQI